jgi:hypothetical protein
MLLGLQYSIVYKKGLDNKAADALSRKVIYDETHAISVNTPRWLEIIEEGYTQDEQTKLLLTELSVSGSNDKGFSLKDGLIRYKGKVWLGSHGGAHKAILVALHNSGLGGHCGIAATYNKVKALFAWPNMKQAVKEYVNQCQVCQQAKPEHTKLPGLVQPLPIPEQAWHTISMDFVEGLPKSKGHDTILVVVDKLTKYGHFLPQAHPFAALTIAKLFHNNVYKLHGLPQVIISDPDKVFTSTLWRELFRLSERTLMSPRGG